MQETLEPKIFSQLTKHSGNWLIMNSVSVEINGKLIIDYEYVDRPASKQHNKSLDAVSMVPIIKSSKNHNLKVVVIANFRPPINKFILEFPGGKVESESIEDNAFRELKEETGYIGHKILNKSDVICNYDAWKSKENGKLLIVEIDGDDERNQKPEQDLDETEVIKVFVLDFYQNLVRTIEELSEKHNFAVSDQLYSYTLGIATFSMLGIPFL